MFHLWLVYYIHRVCFEPFYTSSHDWNKSTTIISWLEEKKKDYQFLYLIESYPCKRLFNDGFFCVIVYCFYIFLPFIALLLFFG